MPRADFLNHEGGESSDDEDDGVRTVTGGGKRKRGKGIIHVDEVFERAQR